jgi:hypothetical protein
MQTSMILVDNLNLSNMIYSSLCLSYIFLFFCRISTPEMVMMKFQQPFHNESNIFKIAFGPGDKARPQAMRLGDGVRIVIRQDEQVETTISPALMRPLDNCKKAYQISYENRCTGSSA